MPARAGQKIYDQITDKIIAGLEANRVRESASRIDPGGVYNFNNPRRRSATGPLTSKKAASAAEKVLRNPKSSKAAKSAAASALTQRPNEK